MVASALEISRTILQYWFASLDDSAVLDQKSEPFATCYTRWYGKDPAIDADIRHRFEPALLAVTGDGAGWEQKLRDWRDAPLGLLALVILLDQFPRNMYRETPRMYAYDSLALCVTTLALRDYEELPLPLVQRMFLYLPLMHAESSTLQQAMVARFERLVVLSEQQSPQNRGFFEYVLEYAHRHRQIVETFGRFPHRNAILGRRSTPAELEFLQRDGSSF